MTASFGVSVLSDVDSVDAVLLRADRLLYVAKEGGRGPRGLPVAASLRGPGTPTGVLPLGWAGKLSGRGARRPTRDHRT